MAKRVKIEEAKTHPLVELIDKLCKELNVTCEQVQRLAIGGVNTPAQQQIYWTVSIQSEGALIPIQYAFASAGDVANALQMVLTFKKFESVDKGSESLAAHEERESQERLIAAGKEEIERLQQEDEEEGDVPEVEQTQEHAPLAGPLKSKFQERQGSRVNTSSLLASQGRTRVEVKPPVVVSGSTSI